MSPVDSAARLVVVPLDASAHDRSGFCCGNEALDRYLRSQATQDTRRRVAAAFVLVEPPSSAILGFYTLSNCSVRGSDLPQAFVRRLPRYPVLPATLLGRLATDQTRRGQGWGTVLLLDAMRRCLRSETASLAVIVDAKDQSAVAFYKRHAFLRLPDHPDRLFKPMAEIEKLFAPVS